MRGTAADIALLPIVDAGMHSRALVSPLLRVASAAFAHAPASTFAACQAVGDSWLLRGGLARLWAASLVGRRAQDRFGRAHHCRGAARQATGAADLDRCAARARRDCADWQCMRARRDAGALAALGRHTGDRRISLPFSACLHTLPHRHGSHASLRQS
eukprot:6206071-Pleurochrysis_carterae.AAC.4